MFCRHCGQQLPADAHFCSRCGSSTSQDSGCRYRDLEEVIIAGGAADCWGRLKSGKQDSIRAGWALIQDGDPLGSVHKKKIRYFHILEFPVPSERAYKTACSDFRLAESASTFEDRHYWLRFAGQAKYEYEQLVYEDSCYYALGLELERVEGTSLNANARVQHQADVEVIRVWRQEQERQQQRLQELERFTVLKKQQPRELPGG